MTNESKNPPRSDIFKISFKNYQNVNDLVEEIKWNSVDKTIFFKAKEDYCFSVYKWIESIKNNNLKKQKGSLSPDLEDSIEIHFLDFQRQEIFVLEFESIKINKHQVLLNKEINQTNELIHEIEINYKEIDCKK